MELGEHELGSTLSWGFSARVPVCSVLRGVKTGIVVDGWC